MDIARGLIIGLILILIANVNWVLSLLVLLIVGVSWWFIKKLDPKGQSFLKRFDNLQHVWLELANRRVTSDSEYSRWRKDFLYWQQNALPLIADEDLIEHKIERHPYIDEHRSFLYVGDSMWRTLEAKANRFMSAGP